jgi:NAD(P)-dependent dehydrogenase (short-subunit alcohol dehydrogenase family)
VTPLVLGTDVAAVRSLAAALDARLEIVPVAGSDAALEAWRQRTVSDAPSAQVVVALWSELPPRETPLTDLDAEAWETRAEAPLLAWSVALSAAAARCADGGAVVGVIEAPAALDAAGFGPEVGLAAAVRALARSLAASEGARGVRVNTVTTPARLGVETPIPAPPLASFPGSVEREVAGAVRLLLSADAAGLTGCTLAADCGRAW